jgi:hypothetical protein
MPTQCHFGESPIVFPDRAPASRPSSWVGPRVIALIVMAGVLLAGCRTDSFTSPQAVDCTGQPGCPATPSAAVDPTVYASLDDATLRLVPAIGNGATQRALTSALHALSQALKDGRTSDARAALADVYVQLAPLHVTQPDGTKVDLPDVAALRLELVPAANALGVQIK